MNSSRLNPNAANFYPAPSGTSYVQNQILRGNFNAANNNVYTPSPSVNYIRNQVETGYYNASNTLPEGQSARNQRKRRTLKMRKNTRKNMRKSSKNTRSFCRSRK